MAEGHRNPFEGVTDFFSELARMRHVGAYGYEPGHEVRERTSANAWVPATDIFSRDADLGIRIELAGVRPEDVSITFSQGVLRVSGERRTALGTGGDDSFHVRERYSGAFRRAITLPEGCKEEHIEADFENGLLEITVAGAAAASEPTRIELKRKRTS
jgi:HSP20 family protein